MPLPTVEFNTVVQHSWCPGCGDAVILQTVKKTLKELALKAENVVFVSGIGCGSKFPHYVNTYGLEGLHGRTLPNASGVGLANNKLTVIAIGGDGDGYGIGMNHFIQTCRRNMNITYIVQNNEVYGLTKGQTSPTSPKGFVSPTTPSGAIEVPVNPMALALSAGATFIARGYSLDPNHLKMILTAAIKHQGFSVVDVLQTCPTWNKEHDITFYKGQVYKLEDDKTYDRSNWEMAMKKSQEKGKIALGIFYWDPAHERATYQQELPQMSKQSLAEHDISNIDIGDTLKEYM